MSLICYIIIYLQNKPGKIISYQTKTQVLFSFHLPLQSACSLLQQGTIREIQASEVSIGQGFGLIMTEAAVRYLSQVVHGDILEVLVCAIEVKKTSFVLQYKAFRQQDGCQVAVGTTTLCAFDYTSMKIARLPEPFRQSLLDQMTTN